MFTSFDKKILHDIIVVALCVTVAFQARFQ
jgi:hypothetical protein